MRTLDFFHNRNGGSVSGAQQPAGSRQALVDAAAKLFATNGFQRTTIDAVATRAGISRGSIFWFFGSKEGLLWAVWEDYLNRQLQHVKKQTRGLTGVDALRVFLGYRAQMLERDAGLWRLGQTLIAQAVAAQHELPPPFIDASDRISRLVAGWIEEELPAGSAPTGLATDQLARLIVHAIHGATQWWLLNPKGTDIEAELQVLQYLTERAVGLANDGPRGLNSTRAQNRR